MLWRKSSFLRLEAQAELWLEQLGYTYGEDALITYKATARGLRMAVDFDAGIDNLEARTASGRYRSDPRRFLIRAQAMTMTWWRMHYKPSGNDAPANHTAFFCGLIKALWVLVAMMVVAVATCSAAPLTLTAKGIVRGVRESRSGVLAALPPYVSPKSSRS